MDHVVKEDGGDVEKADWGEVEKDEIHLVLAEMAKEGKESLFILNTLRGVWKWSINFADVKMKLYRPKNVKWQRSVIGTSEGKVPTACIFSPYKDYAFLKSALCESNIIKWEKGPMVYFKVPKEISCHLENTIVSTGVPVVWNFIFNSFWLPPETAKQFKTDVPDGYSLTRLDQSHVSTVNSAWPYAGETSLALVSDTILVNETVGLVANKNSQLVSWILHAYYGLGMLYTSKEHRRIGHGTTVVKALSKRLAEKGTEIALLVQEDNVEAFAVFQKLGFQETGRVQVIQLQSKS